jgi:hypothetical protein
MPGPLEGPICGPSSGALDGPICDTELVATIRCVGKNGARKGEGGPHAYTYIHIHTYIHIGVVRQVSTAMMAALLRCAIVARIVAGVAFGIKTTTTIYARCKMHNTKLLRSDYGSSI